MNDIDINSSPPTDEPDRQYHYMAKCKSLLAEKSLHLGRPLTMCVQTFGCQMNAHDSEKIIAVLERVGYLSVDTEDADLVLYNTCTVRENANERVYGRLGNLKRLKKNHPDKLVALCGCMMQEAKVVATIQTQYPWVDVVFGTHNIYKLAELLHDRLLSGEPIIDVWDHAEGIVEDLPVERKYPFKAGVNVTYGCDNYCSYCIVPYVRGRERSRALDDVVREIRTQVADGVVEVMLLGQNVNSYGKNLPSPTTFAKLLKEIERIDGLKRIRFMTSHPKDLSDDLIQVMGESKKVCKHLHLPLQSGSSRILQLMNRRYGKEDYLSLVERIRSTVPDISLTTDVIVGFPGETEEDFLETLDVVEKVRFDGAFTFQYSVRTGTPAADMEGRIGESVMKERFDRLLSLVNRIAAEECGRHEGRVMEVLVESVNQKEAGYVTGRLDNNSLVHLPGDESLIGKIVDVLLRESRGFYYLGERR